MSRRVRRRKGRNKIKIILGCIFLVGVSSFVLLFYGPWHGFRDFWITSAMTTMSHQYLATWLYSDKTIEKVLESNKVIEPDELIDTSLIDINDTKNDNNVYKNEYEKQVLEHKDGEIYKYFRVEGYSFDAYMAVIYDPSKISVVTSKYLGSHGEYLVDMARANNAVVAINGGGFHDANGQGNGGLAVGVVIKNGEIIQDSRNRAHGGGVIGFTKDNKLFLGDVSAYEAINKGVRDAVEFGPFLVINGKASFVQGNGGYGIHPRSAIGQRKDGIVLFLVVDGRRVDSLGTDMRELTEIMVKYGAFNAANLDGGNSSVLVINNKIMNKPISWSNIVETRPIATGFIVTK